MTLPIGGSQRIEKTAPSLPLYPLSLSIRLAPGAISRIANMGALAIVDRLLRGNFELGFKITLGFFPMRS